MANLYGDNYQAALVDEPSSKVSVKDLHGKKRGAYDSITLGAEVALNDVIYIAQLPKGAKLIDARVVMPSDGTSGQYDIGWLSNGSDAADQDGIFAGATEVDSGAGAVDAKMLGTAAGYHKEFANATDIVATCIEATTASSGDKLQFELEYVVE